MKVLHIAQTLPGGIASYLDEIIPAQIAAYGVDQVRLAAPRSQLGHLRHIPDEVLIPIATPKRNAGALWQFYRSLHDAISREAPDVVHLHSSFAGALGRLPYLFRNRRPHIVYCAHGWSFTMDAPPAKRIVYRAVERMLAHATDDIITISQSEFEAAERAGIPKHKLRTVLSGVDANANRPRRAPGASRAPLRLLFIGRHDRQKGLDLLLGAMARIEDRPIHLDVIGSGVLDGTQADPRPNVTFHGWQPRERLGHFLKTSDAVVMPSRWEGFGLVAIEAMRAGRAVIASDAGALPEVIADGVVGHLFPRGDVDALARLLGSATREEMLRMGAAGRRRFLELFTSDRMNREIMASYRSLAGVAATMQIENPFTEQQAAV